MHMNGYRCSQCQRKDWDGVLIEANISSYEEGEEPEEDEDDENLYDDEEIETVFCSYRCAAQYFTETADEADKIRLERGIETSKESVD